MLLSKKAMKKANMKLDLANDKAEIYGQAVHLQITSTGHYCVPLKETSVQIKNCSTVVEADENIVKVITKLHKQFAHSSANRLKGLLRDAGVLNQTCCKVIDELAPTCSICCKFQKTPLDQLLVFLLQQHLINMFLWTLKNGDKESGFSVLLMLQHGLQCRLSLTIKNLQQS